MTERHKYVAPFIHVYIFMESEAFLKTSSSVLDIAEDIDETTRLNLPEQDMEVEDI